MNNNRKNNNNNKINSIDGQWKHDKYDELY